jgi:hypothetical protein
MRAGIDAATLPNAVARELHDFLCARAPRLVATHARHTNHRKPVGQRSGTQENNREHPLMSQQSEPDSDAKNRSWIFLVAAFVILVVIGILNS